MTFLQTELKDVDPSEWGRKYLSYISVSCNVDRLKLLQKPLPLPGHMGLMWQKIQKVIDPLHIDNHKVSHIFLFVLFQSNFIQKRPECKVLYPPSKVKSDYPDANLMTCEELFAWLGRFKKLLNSMTKNHSHFFLHRMVIRRNKYTEYCHLSGKYPLLPSIKVLK